MLLLMTMLCVLLLPGCIPLYIAGARMAVSTVAVVASGVTAGGGPAGAAGPQERAALYEGYVRCLQQRELNPGVDCASYRTAMEATTP